MNHGLVKAFDSLWDHLINADATVDPIFMFSARRHALKYIGLGTRCGIFDAKHFALTCSDGRLFFFNNGEFLDVTEPSWTGVVRERGLLRTRFSLMHERNEILRIDFFEMAFHSPEDTDGSFFSDVCHWLKSTKSRTSYCDYIDSLNN